MTDQTAPVGAPAMPKAPIPRVVDIYHGDILVSDVHRTDPVARTGFRRTIFSGDREISKV
jgi:hypothetical protein